MWRIGIFYSWLIKVPVSKSGFICHFQRICTDIWAQRTLDLSPAPSACESLTASTTTLSGAKLWLPIFRLCDCFRIAEWQMTLAPAAGASMTSICDSSQDLTPERSPFPVDHGGFMHANALFCHCHSTLCQERGNSSSCKSMSLAQRVLCWVVLSRMWLVSTTGLIAVLGSPWPLITLHLWLVQISPLSLVGVPRLHSEQTHDLSRSCHRNTEDSSGRAEVAADARVPNGCLLQSNQPGSI